MTASSAALPRVFLEGPAGTGKTSYAVDWMLRLLESGVPAERILVFVPQRLLGDPYQAALRDSPLRQKAAGRVTVVTLSGLARRYLERFWPLVAEPAGFSLDADPVFLTIETAQYYMMRFARPYIDDGVFDSISLTPPRIATQLLDNMAKAAVGGFPFEDVADRLKTAWGEERHSSRLLVYDAGQMISAEYRDYCQQNNLLDYAFQLEVFIRHLLPHPVFRKHFGGNYDFLIVDNVEEMGPAAHYFLQDWWEHWQDAVIIYDTDAGFRTFLGADPEGALELAQRCDEHLLFTDPAAQDPAITALDQHLQAAFGYLVESLPDTDPRDALKVHEPQPHIYFPEMVDWAVDHVIALVADGVPPGEIAVLAPFLPDALRFSLQSRLDDHDIPTVTSRPSRELMAEPAARAMITLLRLAHPHWEFPPPPQADVADMLSQVVGGLDPVRARLLAQIVYKPSYGGTLSSFDEIQGRVRDRITYQAGENYERLREWLLLAAAETANAPWPVDYFLSRLFGEVLAQPGQGFHGDLDSGRVVAQLIESARKFRQVLYPQTTEPDWNAVGQEYFQLLQEGVLAALSTASWRETLEDAVLLAPAFTFLMRNRAVDYQFWLDVGAESWWERLDQPLTHPYVLTRRYPPNRSWTEDDEIDAQRAMLHRIMTGLVRRCRKRIFLGISDLGEQGYEQRGPMLFVFQQIMQAQGDERDGA